MTTYTLPLSPAYVSNWGVAEACRELIQNALDSEAPFEWALGPDYLSIISRGVTLSARDLVLGNTSKAAAPDKIGSFGEGFKLALLVLAREGVDVMVHNGSVVWVPSFKHDPQWESDVLVIDQFAGPQRDGLQFELRGLTPEQIEGVVGGCLAMQEPSKDDTVTPLGTVLRGHPGKLFVGGLFVSHIHTRYGYDIPPRCIDLERDRRTVSSFELLWAIKSVWAASERWEEVAQMMEEDAPDVSAFRYDTPEPLRDACLDLFLRRNPGCLPASDQDEVDELSARGAAGIRVVNPLFGGAARSSQAFLELTKDLQPPPSPQAVLEEWWERNKAEVPASFLELIEQSKQWRNS